ncbi:MAG: hypothetical protein ABJZ55_01410 [Fuerstiella sp.]
MNVPFRCCLTIPCLILSGAIVGCSEAERPSAPPVMTTDSQEQGLPNTTDTTDTSEALPTTSDSETSVAGLKFDVPEGWKRVELSDFQMGIIAARFTIPVDDEEITVTLSRSGGGSKANLDRWRGQVEANRDEVLERLTLAGQPAVLLDLQGRFSPGFGKPAADNQRMLGTIIEMPEQGYFIKLTGSAKAASKVEADFRKFLKSAKKA